MVALNVLFSSDYGTVNPISTSCHTKINILFAWSVPGPIGTLLSCDTGSTLMTLNNYDKVSADTTASDWWCVAMVLPAIDLPEILVHVGLDLPEPLHHKP